MILYIDETENSEHFIVTGLLLESEQLTNNIYYSFKKKIVSYKVSNAYKAKLYTEFKSHILDSRFQSIKKRMLTTITSANGAVIYSTHIKKDKHINQELKEEVYIKLLGNIVSSITEDIDIIFDEFKNSKFEEKIINSAYTYPNVKSAKPDDSQLVPGLQFVDNLCSVLRLKLSNQDKYDFYSYIEGYVKEV